MQAIWRRKPKLRMKAQQWHELGEELGRRSGGTRETGAFLLGQRRGRTRRVITAVFYDDLDPNCLRGDIHLAGSAYGPLWELCRSEGITVVADVHTHGGTGVAQSSIDAANPMIATRGHLAVIVPHLAQQRYTPAEVGIHEYLGEEGWRTWKGKHAARRVHLGGRP